MNGISARADAAKPQDKVSRETELSPARAEGSAAPVFCNVENAFIMPMTVPIRPSKGESTMTTAQNKAAHPNHFLDRVTLARRICSESGVCSKEFIP